MARGRRWWAAIVLWAAVLAGGCRLDAQLEVTLDGDGGGDLVLAFEVDEDLAAEAAAAGVDPIASIAEAGAGLEPWDVDVGDDRRSVTLIGEFAGPDALESAIGDLADALAQPEVAPLAPFELIVGDDELTVHGGASLALSEAVLDVGFEPDEALAALAGGVDYRVAVTMPGEVLAHEGGRRDGPQRVVWDVEAGEDVAIEVAGERPTALSAGWLAVVAGGIAAVGVLLLAGAVALRRR